MNRTYICQKMAFIWVGNFCIFARPKIRNIFVEFFVNLTLWFDQNEPYIYIFYKNGCVRSKLQKKNASWGSIPLHLPTHHLHSPPMERVARKKNYIPTHGTLSLMILL